MNGPFIISRGPSGECHCAFQTSLCDYIPLFALHVVLSSDWLSWCPDCFSRHPWIPLIQPSFKSFHVCRHLPPYNPTPWGCELGRIPWDGEITIKPRAFVTIEGFAESCNSVLHLLRKVYVEVRIWVEQKIWGAGPPSLHPSWGEHSWCHRFWLRLAADSCLCWSLCFWSTFNYSQSPNFFFPPIWNQACPNSHFFGLLKLQWEKSGKNLKLNMCGFGVNL